MTATQQPESKSPSRRALLAGALGGVAAWAVGAVRRPNQVAATDGQALIVGQTNTATVTTEVTNTTNGAAVLWGNSTSGYGVYGSSGSSYGVYGSSGTDYGVFGSSGSGYGVYGSSDSSVGVYGDSPNIGVWGQGTTSGTGVYGHAVSGYGVYAHSGSGIGLWVESISNVGLFAYSEATNHPASAAQSFGDSTGVLGYSGTGGSLPAAKAKTGVYGFADQDASAKGIYGESSNGYAGYFAGKVFTTKYHEMTEISAPAAPAASRARLFVRDNGSGKTQLCVRFSTGGVLVIKTQP